MPPLNQVYTVDYSSTNVRQHQNSSISKDLKGISVWCSFWCWKSLSHHLSDDLTPWQFIHPPSAVPAARRICVGHLEGLPSFPIINLRLSDECVARCEMCRSRTNVSSSLFINQTIWSFRIAVGTHLLLLGLTHSGPVVPNIDVAELTTSGTPQNPKSRNQNLITEID